MSLTLRSYQAEALDAVERSLLEHNRVLVISPVGTGKTVMFSHLAKAYADRGRVLILVHRDELAEQAKTKLQSVAPELSVGVVKAERNEADADIVIGSIQTLARDVRRQEIRDVALVICDEAHHAAAKTWIETLEHYGCFANESAYRHDGEAPMPTPAVGFTATAHREDGRGLGNVWEVVAWQRDIEWAVERGYLCDVRGQQVTIDGFDLASIARSKGDYVEGKLGDAMEEIGAGEIIANAYLEHARGRQGIMFAPTVSSATAFAEDFNTAGIRTEVITGTTTREERHDIYRRYERREIDVMSSVMVLCLDTETEILTSTGWVRHDEMTYDHEVANWDQGNVFFERPKEIVRRPLGADERMYVLRGKGRSIRVTGGHRMLYRTHKSQAWKKTPVEDLVGRSVLLPTVGYAEPAPIQAPEVPGPAKNAHLKTEYNLRKREGYSYEESKVEAARRLERRYGLRKLAPSELSLDQCRFIGFWIGDGSLNRLRRSGVEYTASQSVAYPKIIEWFDKVIAGCGFDHVRRDCSTWGIPHIRWSFPRGTGSGSQQRDGVFPIEHFLDKDGSPFLWGLNAEQFNALLEGLWYADGNHRKAEDGYPSGFSWISATRKGLLDLLQAIGVTRGIDLSVYRERLPTSEKHQQLYRLSRSATVDHSTNSIRFAPDDQPWRPEEVWCVKTTTRNIITRRLGTVTVMGNTEGFDMPQAEVCVMARPTQNPALYQQCIGRVLRPFPGKTEALVLDVVGIAGRHQLRTLANLTKVNVEPGESLAEAQKRVELEVAEARERTKIEKAHSSREVELFANSHSVWLQTRAGIWFVPTAAGIFFLWPHPDQPGAWMVGYKSQRPRLDDREQGWVLGEQIGLTLEYAMAHGEALANSDDPTVSMRDRQWRRGKPSEAQLKFAATLRVAPMEELVNYRRGALSDAISIAVASKALDKFVSAA